jgi:hypothetical protein
MAAGDGRGEAQVWWEVVAGAGGCRGRYCRVQPGRGWAEKGSAKRTKAAALECVDEDVVEVWSWNAAVGPTSEGPSLQAILCGAAHHRNFLLYHSTTSALPPCPFSIAIACAARHRPLECLRCPPGAPCYVSPAPLLLPASGHSTSAFPMSRSPAERAKQAAHSRRDTLA